MTQLKTDGTFITLSQYLEDLTRYNSEGESYQISPSSYKCFNCNFSGWSDDRIITEISRFEEAIRTLRQSETGCDHEKFTGEFDDHFTFLSNKTYSDDIRFGDMTLVKIKNGKISKYIVDYAAMKKELGV